MSWEGLLSSKCAHTAHTHGWKEQMHEKLDTWEKQSVPCETRRDETKRGEKQ